MPCGCKVEFSHKGMQIVRCTVHAAAPALLAELKAIESDMQISRNDSKQVTPREVVGNIGSLLSFLQLGS